MSNHSKKTALDTLSTGILICTAVLMAQPAFAKKGAAYVDQYAAGTGVLSYTFFNLSGVNCTLEAYGGYGNPYAYTSEAKTYGWNNQTPSNQFSNNAAMFNWQSLTNTKIPQSAAVFYNTGDPLQADTVPSVVPTLNNGGAYPDTGGTAIQIKSSETGTNDINYPALADSWSIQCPVQSTTQPIAIANMASAGSGLINGNAEDVSPFNYSQNWWFNYDLNPPAAAYANSTSGGPCDWGANNLCGMGFTAAASGTGQKILNWNSSDPATPALGGLWSGINYNSSDTAYPASGMLNLPMLPINLSNYVQASADSTSNWYSSNSPIPISAAPIYGGHFTVAVGDPFLISSYAAKALWYLVIQSAQSNTASSFTLNTNTSLSAIANQLSNSTSGVFGTGSFEDNYIQWLVGSQASSMNYPGSPSLAASAYKSAIAAASVPLTKESIWGKVFSSAANAAITSSILATGDVGAAIAVSGTLEPEVDSLIGNAFTSQTSAPTPVSQNAPLVLNSTYAATDLFGLVLSNYGVQGAINTAQSSAVINNAHAFWSNYSIYIDNLDKSTTGCQYSSLQLVNNFLEGTCYPSGGGAAVYNNSNTTATGTYQNVYADQNISTGFSIWNAILTGSNVTTDANGNFTLGDNAGDIPYFSPPMMLWNATNGTQAPSNVLPSGLDANTTFNLNTGYVSLNGYQISTTTPATEVIYPTPVTLNYNLCVQDPWATGGVLIAVTSMGGSGQSGTATLGCVCIPDYLDGTASSSQSLGGVTVGATSANSGQMCPTNKSG